MDGRWRYRWCQGQGELRWRWTRTSRPRSTASASVMAPTRRATVPALEAMLYEPIPVLDHGFIRAHRLYGRRRGDRAGGAGLLRTRHQAGQRRPRPDQLSDAPPAHEPVRDVRAQAAREAADLRRAAVDPAPHRQRQRVLRPLLGARSRVLHPRQGSLEAGQGHRARRSRSRSACSPCPGAEHTAAQSATNKQGRDEVLARGDRGRRACARSAASAAAASPSTRSCSATTSDPGSRANSLAWSCH